MESYIKLLWDSSVLTAIATMLVGAAGWLIKNYLVDLLAVREQAIQIEWRRRLHEVWSPLYYLSGVVLFDGTPVGWERHGVREIEKILLPNANLLPLQHYQVIIKLIEGGTGQNVNPLQLADYLTTRRFIYQEVERYNYLLYRSHTSYEPYNYTSPFSLFSAIWRGLFSVAWHITLWLFIIFMIYMALWVFGQKIYLGVTFVTLLFILLMSIVVWNKLAVQKAMKRS